MKLRSSKKASCIPLVKPEVEAFSDYWIIKPLSSRLFIAEASRTSTYFMSFFLQHFFRKFIVMNITAAFFLVFRFAVYDFPSFHADSAMMPESRSTEAEA
ncbi:hypothetical protein [Paenibacillus kribbensis]|uniref:hypothetical protein n=1 Tax=Paenibacillus kribbensis TaxID=172713 RepID=UPI0015BD7DC5|nr:hypothetical protein [Paenibacillus kribbensis]